MVINAVYLLYGLIFISIVIAPCLLIAKRLSYKTCLSLFYNKGGLICLALICSWGFSLSENFNQSNDFIIFGIYLSALFCLAMLCFEDLHEQMVSMTILAAAILLLTIGHILRVLPEQNILFSDFLRSSACAVGLWILTLLFRFWRKTPAIGGADIPLFFALSLGLTLQGIGLWIGLFSASALVIFGRNLASGRRDKIQQNYSHLKMPLIPYMVSAAALMHMMG